jgi:hypothetical protein
LADPTTTLPEDPLESGLELLELLALPLLPLLPHAASATPMMTAKPPNAPLFRADAFVLTRETGNMASFLPFK